MTKQERVQKIYDAVYDFLNYTSTCLSLKGNKIHVDMDCFGEFDLIVDVKSIRLCEEYDNGK